MKKWNKLLLWGLFSLAVGLAAVMLLGDRRPRQTETLRRLEIFYTNDEHGYIEATPENGGAAGLAAQWQRRHNYDKEGPFLVLSGGDMLTGPAVSTLLEGEPAIDIFNTLGYDAAALGNHDFDFGLNALEQRAAQAGFPFLAANLRNRTDGRIPAFARAGVLIEVNGLRVGVVGLTTIEVPYDTRPSHVEGLRVMPYAEALREAVPTLWDEGADLVIGITHLCNSELKNLAETASELGVTLLGGGHCHEELNEPVAGVQLVQSGSFLRRYVHIELYYDTSRRQVVWLKAALEENEAGGSPSGALAEAVASQVAGWQERAAAVLPELYVTVGFAGAEIGRRSELMAYLLTQSWLEARPGADVALASLRYIQVPLPKGEISPADVVSVLATPNTLVELRLSGTQLVEVIEKYQPLMGGVHVIDEVYYVRGKPLEPEASYTVLVPVALYEGANLYDFQAYPVEPVDTAIDWRLAVIEWLRSHPTGQENPLAVP